MAFHTASGQSYTLGSSISSAQTSILLTSFTVPVTGSAITMATMDTSIAYGTLAPGTSSAELISFTGVTQNADGTATLTGVTRGLDKQSPYTEVTAFKQPHAGQTIFILSDAPQVFNKYGAVANDNTFTGNNTFSGTNTFTGSTIVQTPTLSTQAATKGYVDGVAIAGAPDASTTVKGITKMSVAPASATSPIAVGDNDGRVPTQGENDALVGDNTDIAVGTGNKFVTQTGLQKNAEKYAADAGGTDAYAITLSPVPTSYATGMVVYFKANTANTGAATLNVNSLGAKTIVKGVNTTLADGDIAASQYCTVIYDGTNFVLQSPTSNGTVYKNGITTKNAADASTTQNIAHGLGSTPRFVTINAYSAKGTGAGNVVPLYAYTVYNGTTQSSYSIYGAASANSLTESTSFILNNASSTDTQTGVVTFDSTNIIITWTKSGSPTGTYNIVWTAQA